jgi:hypothetical protein
MYRFSRSIYRELAPLLVEDAGDPEAARQRLLEACEAAIQRLAYDRRYFARPARWLFGEVRTSFPISEQLHAFKVIECNINLALEHLAKLPPGVGLDGRRPQCQANTRRGTPCAREPLPHSEYCPSHKHLDEAMAQDPVGAAA